MPPTHSPVLHVKNRVHFVGSSPLNVLNCSSRKESTLFSTPLKTVHKGGASRRKTRVATSNRRRAFLNNLAEKSLSLWSFQQKPRPDSSTVAGRSVRRAQPTLKNFTARDPRCRTRRVCRVTQVIRTHRNSCQDTVELKTWLSLKMGVKLTRRKGQMFYFPFGSTPWSHKTFGTLGVTLGSSTRGSILGICSEFPQGLHGRFGVQSTCSGAHRSIQSTEPPVSFVNL